jgi:glycosyltransferase involved in cell wall biosynthesis
MQQHAAARVVYVNSAPSVELARLLPPAERILLSHVHELEIGLTHLLHPQDRLLFLEGPRRLFAASEAVRRNLVDRHGIDPAVIVHHTEMVDARSAAAIDHSPATLADRRRARGLPADGLIVGSSGTLDWRKASDLFLRMAWHLTRDEAPEPLTFVWVGGNPERVERAREEARVLGVDHVVRFVGVQPDPVDWFALLDVFVLPAREDPFPLVCLEAASVGVPIVAFDNGGMPELLEQGCGLVVSYPDVTDFAEKVQELLRDPGRRRRMGERGMELVGAKQDVTVAAPQLWADIEPWLA